MRIGFTPRQTNHGLDVHDKHTIHEALRDYGDRMDEPFGKVLVINAGKIGQFAAPEKLLKNPATEFVRNLVAN